MLEGVLKAQAGISGWRGVFVSILGMLEGVLKVGLNRAIETLPMVSILGMLEGVLKAILWPSWWAALRFQSLVCWRGVKKDHVLFGLVCICVVSILGMLEGC